MASAGDKITSLDLATRSPDRRDVLFALRRQLEWYLSDANLSADQLLHDRISQAMPGGWLSCRWLMQVKRMVPFDASLELIFEAMRGSHLELRFQFKPMDKRLNSSSNLERCLFLRRRQPLPPLLRSECRGFGFEVPVDPLEAVLRDPHGTLNRLRDQWRVQEQLRIKEIGDSTTVFYEQLLAGAGCSGDLILAVGYERVLYGDDGPYIELNHSQVRWDAWPYFHNKRGYEKSYYDEYFTDTSHWLWCKRWRQWAPHPNTGVLMLYAQKHSVRDRPWAPSATSKPHAWRQQGYADYRPGYYYIAADHTLVATHCSRMLAKAKGSGGCNGTSKAVCGADGKDPGQERALSPRQEELPQPRGHGLALAAGWNECWHYRLGRCQRGAQCKWKHC